MTATPPVEVPPDRDMVVEMLREASELEHALCVQYLYAAFSLKGGGDAGLTSSQVALTGQWRQQVTRIALQEMYHLMLASNILTAMGAAPHLWRPNLPQPATRYSNIDVPSSLSPFGLETVSRFLCWEKPDQPGWWDAYCRQCGEQAHARLGLVEAAAEPPPYSSIGELYGLIKQALLQNPGWVDPATAPRQVTSQVVPFKPTVAAITTVEQAAGYIDIIVTEGEGTSDWDSMSHFAYFHQIVDQLRGFDQKQSAFAAAWPTVDNPIFDPAHQKPGTSLIQDAAVQPVGEVFNDLYLLLVLVLTRLFQPEDETAAERQSLANAAMALMPLGIEPLAILLTRLPAGDRYPGLYAGPGFELPQTIDGPGRAREEAFSFLYDAMLDVTRRCRVLSIDDTGLGTAAQDALGTIAARLETLLPMFELGHEAAGVGR